MLRRVLRQHAALAATLMGLLVCSPVTARGDVQVGDMAPEFKLVGSDGKTYQLSDFRDKQFVVIAWFPKAFTGGCTKECKSFRDQGEQLRKWDVAYFTASVDDAETNKKFAESLELDYPILSDPGGKVASAYGLFNGKVARRWTIFVDKSGKIVHIDKEVKSEQHAQDVAAKLKELGVGKE